jgi:hypothetical protein
MSFMLLGTPQNRNRAVTRINGRVFPTANKRGGSLDRESCFKVGIQKSPVDRVNLPFCAKESMAAKSFGQANHGSLPTVKRP